MLQLKGSNFKSEYSSRTVLYVFYVGRIGSVFLNLKFIMCCGCVFHVNREILSELISKLSDVKMRLNLLYSKVCPLNDGAIVRPQQIHCWVLSNVETLAMALSVSVHAIDGDELHAWKVSGGKTKVG